MEDKVNQNISEKENQKLEKIAFISILLALVYIFLKFFKIKFVHFIARLKLPAIQIGGDIITVLYNWLNNKYN